MSDVSVKRLLLRAIVFNMEIRLKKIMTRVFYRLAYNELKMSYAQLRKDKKELEDKIILEQKIKEQEEERLKTLRYYFQRFNHNCRTNKILSAIKIEKEKRIQEKKIMQNKKVMKLVYNKEKKKNKFMLSMFMKLYYRGIYRQMIRGNINFVEIERKKEEKPKEDITVPSNNLNFSENATKVSEVKKNPLESLRSTISTQMKTKEESIEDTITSLLPSVEEQKKVEDIKKEEEKPKGYLRMPEGDSSELKKNKARNLRKLLNKKRQLGSINLKVYFNRFYLGCLFTSVKSTIMRRSATIQPISEDIFREEEEEKDIKMEKLREEYNKKQIEIEEKRIQTEREKEIQIKFKKVFNQKERLIQLFIHSNLQKWNLRTKIIKIKELTKKPKRKMLRKTKTKTSFDTSINKIKNDLHLNNNDKVYK